MSRRPRVLVIDDNVALAEDLREILEDEDLAVEVAGDGFEALDLMSRRSFDLVLTDVRMPGMNGVEVLRYVKERWPGLPVLVMSGYARDSLLEEAHAHGALGVLPKPFDLDELVELVARGVRGETPVLIVEDDPLLRSDLVEALREVPGALPHAAASEAEARRLADAVTFKAAVVDIRLPDGDGLVLGRWLREHYDDDALPVVYVTGHAEDVRRSLEAVLRAPTVHLMEKPLDLARLIDAVRAMV